MEKVVKYYIDTNDNYYIESETFIEAPTKLHHIQYKPCFYNNDSFKRYTAYIRQADDSYIKVKPYIYTAIEIAIAGTGIAGISHVSS